MSAEAVAIVGVGVALLAMLVPLLLSLGRRLDRIDARLDARTARALTPWPSERLIPPQFHTVCRCCPD